MRKIKFIVLIILAVFCPPNQVVVAQQTFTLWPDNSTTLTVCTSSYTPMVYCDANTDPSLWSGYEIELFRRLVDRLNWPQDKLIWKCLDWQVMIADLAAGNNSCQIAAAGIPVTTKNLDSGIVFSWPTYKNGLSIAVSSEQETPGKFAFFDAFEWELWVAIFGTVVFVGLLVFGIDVWMRGMRCEDGYLEAGSGENRKLFDSYLWEVITLPTAARGLEALSLAGNFIVLGVAFMWLVLLTLYTANTTAIITTYRLQSSITGVQDLPGKAVGTWVDYTDELVKYGIIATPFPWENINDEESMFNALKSHQIQALVLDDSLLQYRSSSDCTVVVVGSKFEQIFQAVAFQNGTNSTDLLNAVNDALVLLREQGVQESLQNQFIAPPEAACKKLGSLQSNQISFSQVSGLWIILSGCIVLGVVVGVFTKLHDRYTAKHLHSIGSKMQRRLSRARSAGSFDSRASVQTAVENTLALERAEKGKEMRIIVDR